MYLVAILRELDELRPGKADQGLAHRDPSHDCSAGFWARSSGEMKKPCSKLFQKLQSDRETCQQLQGPQQMQS